jgi:hypothetical protein
MKNVLVVIACLSFVLGCSISNLFNRNAVNKANEAKPSPTHLETPTPLPSPSVSPTVAGIVPTLKKSAGKYPYEVKLLENPELKSRLTKLLGSDWPDMKANWNVETPIEIDGSIFKASACQAHNCAANNYVMFVDLGNDNINVYHIEENKGTKTYFEKEKIALPKKFEEETKPSE